MQKNETGFTLIELSIVLVIIGLIIGGVLVGTDMIRAAQIRAQISQIEKYNTATRTFQGKYGALPGDLNAQVATQFGFVARGNFAAQGDGNGIIQTTGCGGSSCPYNGGEQTIGEQGLFWVDLSQVGLVEGGFNTATADSVNFSVTTPGAYSPEAKLGSGNYVYVWSGGVGTTGATTNGVNYFGISVITNVNGVFLGAKYSIPGTTVWQAYNIDQKIDDGFPQTGRVTVAYIVSSTAGYAKGPATFGPSDTSATSPSSTTCYDNGGAGGATQQYSLSQSNGSGMNCALSFRFQ